MRQAETGKSERILFLDCKKMFLKNNGFPLFFLPFSCYLVGFTVKNRTPQDSSSTVTVFNSKNLGMLKTNVKQKMAALARDPLELGMYLESFHNKICRIISYSK